MSVTETTVDPPSTCGACGVTDTEPKHMVLVGYSNPATNGEMFHEHDADRDGVIHYHFDCPSPWHQTVNAEYHVKLADLKASGVTGDALRARIIEGNL